MKNLRLFLLTTFTAGVLFNVSSAGEMTPEKIMEKSHLALFYAADDGISDVKMTLVNSKGKERIREFIMIRLDLEEGGKQKYYMYFKKPHDVSRLTFMIHKLPYENDNRWLYVPSIDLIKRISADDKNSSFVGSDFSYEDVSGRHWSEDNHTLVREDMFGDREVFIIESIPKERYKGFARKVSYIDKEHYLPLKEEYYDKKEKLTRIYTSEKIEVIEGFPTTTIRRMENVKKKRYTTVEFTNIHYNVGAKEEIFTERYLKNPPREYIK